MKTKIFFYNLLFLMMPIFMAACDGDDGPYVPIQPSYRDGEFSGSRLEVTIDGDVSSTVKAVKLESEMLSANVEDVETEDGVPRPSNPTYTSKVTIYGFPSSKKTSSFVTVSTLMGFSGSATIGGVEYDYEGKFTGDPLSRHENQGLILKLTTK